MYTDNQGVVFDMYKTLARVKNPCFYNELFKKLGISSDEKKKEREELFRWFDTASFRSVTSMCSVSAKRMGLQFTRRDLKDLSDALRENIESIELYEDVIPTLKGLKQRYINCGLMSNLSSPLVRVFYKLGLDRYIINKGFSCRLGLAKPDERAFEWIANQMASVPRALTMVGDNPYDDYYGAKNAGFDALLIDRDGSYENAASLDLQGYEKTILADRITDLTEILKRY